ncbi:MAG: ATP-binding protein [Myxococcaceae bacterium]
MRLPAHPLLTQVLSALAHSPDSVVVSDASGRVVGCNEAFRQLFGVELPPGHDLRTDPLLTQLGMVPAIDAAYAGEPQKVSRYSHEPGERSREPDRAAPRAFAVDVSLTPVKQAEGEVVGVIAQAREVPRELTFERQRSLVERSIVGIYVSRPDGTILAANPEACRLLGRTEAELTTGGRPLVVDLTDPRFDHALEQRRRTGQFRGNLRYLRKNGCFEAEVSCSIFPDQDGAELCSIIFRDVTELLELQQQLEMADRLASLGTLAAGVAHEINNPLAFLISNVSFAAEELSPARRAKADLDDIAAALNEACEGANRVRTIVRDLKSMSRHDDETAAPVDLHCVLDAAIVMLTGEVRRRARVVKEYGAIPPVRGTEGRLSQVFLNLLINAAQALPEGRWETNEIRIRTSESANGRVVVEVQDNGCGIPRENLRRIFDPFFTTKPVGVGTGLGLHLCHKFVTVMGGEIQVSSEVGAGTTFRLTFERADPSELIPLPFRAA